MDKNNHLAKLMGGGLERIGDWTPQQLADFIQSQSNDPTQMPHAFSGRQINITENLMLGGKQLEHAVIPRGFTVGDTKGKAVGAYPQHSGSRSLNGAYAAVDPLAGKVFSETYDHRHTTGDFPLNSGVMRYQSLYVPHRERLSHMYVNFSTFEAGGTFTYGGWAIYGPIAYDPAIPGVNLTSIPQIAITPTNAVANFRAGSPYFVQNGYLLLTGSPAWDIVLDPGIYLVGVLYVFSVAPVTAARMIGDTPTYPGIATAELAVPSFLEAATANRATLPATLDITTGWTFSSTRMWAALYNDNSKPI